MNQALVNVTVVALLLLVGCTNVVEKATDDDRWLTKIDQRFNQRDYDYSLLELKKYLEEYPESPAGWCILGWVYAKTDEPDKAHECFDKSLAIDSSWDNAHVGKGVLYRKQGDNEGARQAYLKAISILPDNAEALSSLLVIELLEGNDRKAVEYGEKAWALRKDLGSIPGNLSVAYHYLGDNVNRDKFFMHAKRLNYPSVDTLQDIFDGKIELR